VVVIVKVKILVDVVSLSFQSTESKNLTCRSAKDQSTFMARQLFQQRVLVQLQDVQEKGK